MKTPNRKTVTTFAIGVAACLVGSAIVRSKTAHKVAVHGLAGGLRVKNNALRKVETIREEAQDVYEEARRVADDSEIGATEENVTEEESK
jgi:hypothetical protein